LQFWNFPSPGGLPAVKVISILNLVRSRRRFFSRREPVRGLGKFFSSPFTVASAALIIRLFFLFFLFHNQPVPTGNRYVIGYETGCIAASIAEGRGYSSPLYAESGPTAWITPVYPYLLAGVFKLFGVYTFKASVAIRLLNILFSTLTCFPVIQLGKRLFGNGAGITAGWIWAVLPYSVFFSVVWVWDTSLSALVLTLALLATYKIEEAGTAAAWARFGALWGFAALVNAAVLSVLPGCFLFAAWRARQRNAAWIRLAGFAALAFALTVSPWIIRNQVVFHGQVVFRSNFGLELWLGNNPGVPDSWTWWLHPNDSPEEHDKYLRMGEVPFMQEKQRLAWEFIRTHPADVSRFVYHRFMETWTGNKDSFRDIWQAPSRLVRANLIVNYALPLLTFLGLLFARRRSPALAWPLLNVVALFPVVYYLCHTTPRYRHPIDPVASVLAAFAVVYCVQSARGRFWSADKLAAQPLSAD
jgi:4-amino-4-deoxy-L-arabinose transferase-like glycosyltransferase